MGKAIVKYSEAFKLQVVTELESGKLKSHYEARCRYGIKGGDTIPRWIRQYGKNHLLKKVVRVETAEERDQLKEMKKRNRQLESALADAHLDLCLEKAYVKVACRTANIEDVEGFKKKHAGKLSMSQ